MILNTVHAQWLQTGVLNVKQNVLNVFMSTTHDILTFTKACSDIMHTHA